MAGFNIFGKMNEFLHAAAENLSSWLGKRLPAVGGEEWWDECVLDKLTVNQRLAAAEKGIRGLRDMDLAMLLRVADRNWYHLCDRSFLTYKERDVVTDMARVRNNWAHAGASLPGKDAVVSDLETLHTFFDRFGFGGDLEKDVEAAVDEVNSMPSALFAGGAGEAAEEVPAPVSEEMRPADMVCLVSDETKRGVVVSVRHVDGEPVYTVFLDGATGTFYPGQIRKTREKEERAWLDVGTFRNRLTAYQMNNPTNRSLYSLNSARIDFVPYQFRPVMKMVRSDAPRMLIADSVGVGKTIEAGLMIKELEARDDIESVLIICPKPLVADRKWENEMKRFDEDFVPMDGPMFRRAISDTDLTGEWPDRYRKCIIPYSVLDGRAYNGESKKKTSFGLKDLDPAPRFDLVIVDEAHHIRNGSMEKEKAFAYKCVRYFCDNADAVAMLTATPLQTGDDNLFTLLNVLRPDVVLDMDTFRMMARPNAYVTKAASLIRHAEEGWREAALEELEKVRQTQWGENVTALDPVYRESVETLKKDGLSREERVGLIEDVEGLNSFSTMMNRTLRKDIQDFCIRESVTVSSGFTPGQRALYDELLSFERLALKTLHGCNPGSVEFMTTTLKRQAASCMFGLAPHIDDIVNRRFAKLIEDSVSVDGDDMYPDEVIDILRESAGRLAAAAKALPDEDPKFDELLGIVREKQNLENDKIMIFSTFRHTLGYLQDRLSALGFRVGTINGSVGDEERLDLRRRFELPRGDAETLDIMLFTEVGSEGLDYQFCDTMVNYDLPWNPMAIEQRIGRIDRRGQKSEKVFIYNMITEGTVDAEIYHRCLERIGVFERSIGDCDEILGDIAKGIDEIAADPALTDEEKGEKLERMADNEVMRMKEMEKLESGEKDIFGVDISEYIMSEEVRRAENPWLTPASLRAMTEAYLSDVLGPGRYLFGQGGLLTLRLSADARARLKAESDGAPWKKSPAADAWTRYLKGNRPNRDVTFDSETAERHRDAFHITSSHPLARLAARHFRSDGGAYVSLVYASDDIKEGSYRFSQYTWTYTGISPRTRLVTVCEDGISPDEVTEILRTGVDRAAPEDADESGWDGLERKQIAMWKAEKDRYRDETAYTASRRIESLRNEYVAKRARLERLMAEATDEKIWKMHESELEKAGRVYEEKTAEIRDEESKTDIIIALFAKGIIEVVN